jgi:hypothetical protein
VRLADRVLDGVTCIRLDATVTFAHSDKELAEANFKGFGLIREWSSAGQVAAPGGALAEPGFSGMRVRRLVAG